MFYYTYALSYSLMQKYYPETSTLVTDNFGKSIFVDLLEFKYNDIIIALDDLNEYPKEFWALGKIYTYNLLCGSPFIHIDFDFFLKGKFSQQLESAPLVAYMDEHDDQRQSNYLIAFKKYFLNYEVHNDIKKYFQDYKSIAYNAGVIGGNKLCVFKDLWHYTHDIINRNRDIIARDISTGSADFYMTNVILEQYLFACLAHDSKIPVVTLHNNENYLPLDSSQLFKNTNLPKYDVIYYPLQHVHILGFHKRNLYNAYLIASHLKSINAQLKQRIDLMIEKNLI